MWEMCADGFKFFVSWKKVYHTIPYFYNEPHKYYIFVGCSTMNSAWIRRSFFAAFAITEKCTKSGKQTGGLGRQAISDSIIFLKTVIETNHITLNARVSLHYIERPFKNYLIRNSRISFINSSRYPPLGFL